MPSVTTVTFTVVGVGTAGIEEMLRLPFPFTVKHPGAGPDGHGSSTTGVPACCWLVVPISIAVAPEMLLPDIVTAFPPEIVPVAGVREIPDGDAGSVPAVAVPAYPGRPSAEDAVATVPD